MTRARQRSAAAMQEFKEGKDVKGKAACEICRWRPPVALRGAEGLSLLHGHHILPIACGGTDSHDNLILVCPTHHAIAHQLGRMVRVAGAANYEWRGPRSRRELLGCLAVLDRAEEYKLLKWREHNFLRLLDDSHVEALAMNAPHRGLTLLRGES